LGGHSPRTPSFHHGWLTQVFVVSVLGIQNRSANKLACRAERK
jgi:hypothetical protein